MKFRRSSPVMLGGAISRRCGTMIPSIHIWATGPLVSTADLDRREIGCARNRARGQRSADAGNAGAAGGGITAYDRSEEHTSELQSLRHLVCRLLLEKK